MKGDHKQVLKILNMIEKNMKSGKEHKKINFDERDENVCDKNLL